MANSVEFESVKGHWVPILDYAVKNGMSLSTLRRYIKANKLQYRMENGRYLLWEESNSQPQSDMQRKLLEAYEEINELKMLIAIYEEQLQK